MAEDPNASGWNLPTRPLEEGAAPRPSAPGLLAAGTVLAERFRIVRFIARGGMGDVYEAEDLELQGTLALKTIRPSVARDPQLLARFKREVQLARRVTHPNVSRVFDVFRHRQDELEVTFLTMELLQGDTLGQRIHGSERGRLTPDEALPLAQQMAAGLDAAHKAGVVHRDFKSGNVMLVPEAGGARAVVTDFGVARAHSDPAGAAITGLSETVGSPAYMAPEQVRGAAVGPAADVYAFGVVLYEMVTGTWPFWGENPVATAMMRLKEAPPPPRKHVPELPETWNTVILRCLSREPGGRYASASAAVRALTGESTTAPGGPMLQALTHASRVLRRPGPLALAGGLLIAAVAVGVWLLPRLLDPQPPSAPARRSVAVLGFKNTTGRAESAWLSTALAEMLATELAAGGRLRAIPGEEVARARVELKLPETDGYGRETLARLRANLGADLVVVGSYTALAIPSGNRLRLDVHLQDAAAGQTAARVEAEGAEAELFALVSRAGSLLRANLGLEGVSAADAGRVRGALPASSRAAQLYAEGLSRLRVFEAGKARELLEQAVAAEPDHPLTRSALSAAWAALGHETKAAEEARRALELGKGLARDERLLVEGRAAEASRDWDRAASAWRLLSELYPDEPEHALRLAAAQVAAGKPEASLATVTALRARMAERKDARVDLAEASAAHALSDFRRQLEAAGRAAASARESGAKLLLAGALLSEANALLRLGRLPEARQRSVEARRLFEEAGDLGSAARAINTTATVDGTAGDLDGCERLHQEALAIFRRIGSASGIGSTLVNLASVKIVKGELGAAEAIYREALVMKREQGDRVGLARTFNNLANVLAMKGDLAGAERNLEETLAVYRDVGDRVGLAGGLNNLAMVKKQAGDRGAAGRLYEESLRVIGETGDRESETLTRTNLAVLKVELGELQEAGTLADASLADATAIDNKSLQADALSVQAEVRFWRGELSEARRLAEQALKLRRELGEKQTAAGSRVFLARVALEERGAEDAERLAREALAEYRGEDASEDEAAARAVLARALLLRGRTEEAAAELKAAVTTDPASALRIALVSARVQEAAGKPGDAVKVLSSVRDGASKAGLVALALEARIALARLAGDRAKLEAIGAEARAKGHGLLERRALAAEP